MVGCPMAYSCQAGLLATTAWLRNNKVSQEEIEDHK